MEKYEAIEFEQSKQRIICSLTGGHIQHKKPHAYLVVDAFGTEKDVLPNLFAKKEHGDVIRISSEKFEENMAAALMDSLMKDGYNLIIESTLLDSDSPFRATNLRNPLQDRQYQASLNILFVRPEISYLTLLKKMSKEPSDGNGQCSISMEQHFSDLKDILWELSFLDIFQFYPRIRLFAIDGKCVYDKAGRENSWAIMESEFARELSPEEKDTIRREYAPYVKDSEEMERILVSFTQAFQRKQRDDAREYFEKHKNDPIRKEVVIPYWQAIRAEDDSIDLSKVLQDALDKTFHTQTTNDNDEES